MLLKLGSLEMIRIAHFEPERFAFVRKGDDAAVIVRQHHDGAGFELRLEHALAGTVEAVTIDERKNWLRHVSRLELADTADDNAPNDEFASLDNQDRLKSWIFRLKFDTAA